MSNVELKPCPCGGNAVKIKIFSHKRYDCFYKGLKMLGIGG